jgi:uncharacterized RDD family membrane protein YckC
MIAIRSISAAERLISIVSDHFVLSSVYLALVTSTMLLFGGMNEASVLALLAATLAVYMNKDWFGGQSLAKRLVGQRVVVAHTGEPADAFRCCLRNVTMAIWPIEAVVVLVHPSRRIGDFIAGTAVIPTTPRIGPLPDDAGIRRNGLASLAAIAFSCLYAPLWTIAVAALLGALMRIV